MKEVMFFTKDDYAREPVPLSERRGWLVIAFVWFAAATDMVAVFIGSVLAEGQTVLNGLIAVLIANIILGLIGGFSCYVGGSTRLSTAMITRFVFGEWGSRLINALIIIAFFFMFGVDVGLFGEMFQFLLLEILGIEVTVPWAAFIGGMLMTITATIGYIAIERLSLIAFPLMLFLMAGFMGVVLGVENKREWLTALPDAGITMSMGSAISFVLGSWMIIVVISPDIARWAKTKKDAFLSGFVGFLIGNSVMISLSLILFRVTGATEIVDIFLALGWGMFAILIILLAQWTTNDNFLYTSGLGLATFFRNTPKYILTLIIGLLGSCLAYMQLQDYFMVFTAISGALLGPVIAIYLVDFFLLNRDRFVFSFIQQKKIPYFYWKAFVSWGIASAVGIMTIPAEEGGVAWFHLTRAPILDAFITAAILHWLLGVSFSNSRANKGETTHV